MSNFCGVISNRPNTLEHNPLEFQHLEIVTEWLLGETESLWQDFQTKCQFMQDQQQQILENEKNLIEMNDQLASLKINVVYLEMETRENEMNLQQLERKLLSLQQQVTSLCDCLNCFRSQQSRKCEYERVLDLLERTDNAMNQLKTLMEQISQYEQYLLLQTSPYDAILAILEMQVHILQQTDKNLSALTEKTMLVDETLLQTMDKIAILRQYALPSTNPGTGDQ